MSFNKIDNKYYGYIYKICNTENNKVYIGQTRRDLDIRWKQHLLSLKRDGDKNTVLYRSMNKYGSDKFHIQLIKEYSFESKDELIKTLSEIKSYSEDNDFEFVDGIEDEKEAEEEDKSETQKESEDGDE